MPAAGKFISAVVDIKEPVSVLQWKHCSKYRFGHCIRVPLQEGFEQTNSGSAALRVHGRCIAPDTEKTRRLYLSQSTFPLALSNIASLHYRNNKPCLQVTPSTQHLTKPLLPKAQQKYVHERYNEWWANIGFNMHREYKETSGLIQSFEVVKVCCHWYYKNRNLIFYS